MLADLDTFTNYVDAYLTSNTAVADFYETHFRSDFLPAFDAWIATDPFNNPGAPINPFVMPEYLQPELQRSAELATQADALFSKGEDANQTSDDYVLNTVFLASVLFFTAFAPRCEVVPRPAWIGYIRGGHVLAGSVSHRHLSDSLVIGIFSYWMPPAKPDRVRQGAGAKR